MKVFLPGITDTTTLDAASKLCGTAAFTEHGKDHTSRHEVATADMIRLSLECLAGTWSAV